MIEYAYGACAGKRERCFFINFVLQVSPACDCYNHNDMPVVADIGILASKDPVALDQACADLVIAAPGIPGSALGEEIAAATEEAFQFINSPDYKGPSYVNPDINQCRSDLGNILDGWRYDLIADGNKETECLYRWYWSKGQ